MCYALNYLAKSWLTLGEGLEQTSTRLVWLDSRSPVFASSLQIFLLNIRSWIFYPFNIRVEKIICQFQLENLKIIIVLKYGFCKKLSRYKWTSDEAQQTGQKVRKKVFNLSEVHLSQSNFLQNPYFRKTLKNDIYSRAF